MLSEKHGGEKVRFVFCVACFIKRKKMRGKSALRALFSVWKKFRKRWNVYPHTGTGQSQTSLVMLGWQNRNIFQLLPLFYKDMPDILTDNSENLFMRFSDFIICTNTDYYKLLTKVLLLLVLLFKKVFSCTYGPKKEGVCHHLEVLVLWTHKHLFSDETKTLKQLWKHNLKCLLLTWKQKAVSIDYSIIFYPY